MSDGPALSFSFLGYALRLADPGALRLLAVAGALALLGVVALARRRAGLRRAAGALAPRVAPSANTARPAARLGLSVTALALLAVALSRPQCGTRAEIAKRSGVDLVVVLDASRSMLAADVRPDRLTRAKLEIAALLDSLAGDRVAVVAFAADAFVQCPLTSDIAAAKLFLRAVSADAMPRQGSALAPALLAAKEVLDASGRAARSKVVLLVSDGEDHEGGVASAIQALADAGIRVHALAVGTREGAPVPRDPARAGKDRREPPVTRLDEATLRLVADVGRGDVYGLGVPERGLAAFRAALDRMQRAELEGRLTVGYEDRYALAAFPAFLLLLASLLVREGRRIESEPRRDLHLLRAAERDPPLNGLPLPREAGASNGLPLPREAAASNGLPLPREAGASNGLPLPREAAASNESPPPREAGASNESPLPREAGASNGLPLPREAGERAGVRGPASRNEP